MQQNISLCPRVVDGWEHASQSLVYSWAVYPTVLSKESDTRNRVLWSSEREMQKNPETSALYRVSRSNVNKHMKTEPKLVGDMSITRAGNAELVEEAAESALARGRWFGVGRQS